MSDNNYLTGLLESGENLEAIIDEESLKIDVNIIGTGPQGPIGPPVDSMPAENVVESENRVFLTLSDRERLVNKTHEYVHFQTSPQSSWSINHDLGKFPSVTVKDSARSLIEGEIEYVDENNLILHFSGGSFSGKAYLN